jgi:hypothetical protein
MALNVPKDNGVPTESIFSMPASWLKYPIPDPKNPASMPKTVADQFRELGFTQDDYKAILAADPFASSPGPIDYRSILQPKSSAPRRFVPTTYSFSYHPTNQATDCNSGVCSCLAFSDTVKNELQIQDQHQITYSLEWKNESTKWTGDVDGGAINISNGSQPQGSWKSTTATASIHCPSINYAGPLEIQVWWDTLYGSFVFVPGTLDAQLPPLHQGQLVDAKGVPLRNEPVTLSVGGKTFHAVTDNSGHYTVRALASVVSGIRSKTAQIWARNVTKQVAVGRASTASILRLPQ